MQNTSPVNILVLGAGGNVSQGILKALAISSLKLRVVTACTSKHAFGLYTSDSSYLSPLAKSDQFIPWLLDVCRRECIHAVLSGVEPVLDVLLENAGLIKAETGAICITNSAPAVSIGRDKLLTCAWLRENNFPYPAFAASEDYDGVRAVANAAGFPLLAKPRSGKGSSGIMLIRNQYELERVQSLTGYVIEEYLGDDRQEYTASCYTDSDDRVRGIIVFHRELQHGTTVTATAGIYPEVRREAEEIATALKPGGPLNLQMRIHHGRPVCFELNVRFSGTTPMRARLGFNDVESIIRHYVLGETAFDLPVVASGTVIRYWNELYINTEKVSYLERDGYLDKPHDKGIQIEVYGSKA